MNISPTQKVWISKQLFYKEAVNNIGNIFTKFSTKYSKTKEKSPAEKIAGNDMVHGIFFLPKI